MDGKKTFTENWFGEQSFFVLILAKANFLFFRDKTVFDFQDM